MSQKPSKIVCHNCIKFLATLKIIATYMMTMIELREGHSFSTSPSLCHRTTVFNADVANCYIKKLKKCPSLWRIISFYSSLLENCDEKYVH